MAAVRLRGLGLVDLAARLDARLQLLQLGPPGRHETLSTMIAWSYELLHDSQRSMMDQLSLFAGSFDLDAAGAVCDVDDLSTLLVDLVDRSMVQRVSGGVSARLRLLESVRVFAAGRLATSGARRDTIARFVRYYDELAQRIDEGLRGPDETAWAERLDDELPNLEAAHAHALHLGELDAATRIAVAPQVFVYHRLRADAGALAEATLPAARRVGHPLTSALAALVAVNRLHGGDLDGAEVLLRDLSDQPVARHAHEVCGDLQLYRGDLEAALLHFETAESLARELPDRFTVLHSRMSRGLTLGYLGRTADGLQLLERVRCEASECGRSLIVTWCDFAAGELLAESEPEQALALVDRAVVEADHAGWRMVAGVGRLTASSLRARSEDPADAVPGFEWLLRHWEHVGDETHQWTTLRNLVELLTRLGAYTPAARLLGALGTATRPTFGSEQRRLEAAMHTMRVHLRDELDALIRAGAEDDLAAALELGLTALSGLGDDHHTNRHRGAPT